MDELHRTADKLFIEVDHLRHVLDGELDAARTELALSVAKSVRRKSTLLLRLIASYRDNELQP